MRAWILFALCAAACTKQPPEQSAFAYPATQAAACASAARTTAADAASSSVTQRAPSRSDEEATPRGVKFSVRAPLNYDAAHAHPLLLLYAPAGYSRFSAERYYAALTREATAAGWVVAYADHVRLSVSAVQALGEVPARVAQRWCIDPARVYFAGHSDGGSISMGVTFMQTSTLKPAAIAASGAGIRGSDLTNYQCPRPTAITLLHSVEDERFPGYGEEAIAWWARCNACGARASTADADGCFSYTGCAAVTRFCATRGEHAHWPASAAVVVKFLAGVLPPGK